MRRAGALVLILSVLAWLLAGCSFWDWLAGQPITSDPVASGGPEERPAGDPSSPPSPGPGSPPGEAPEGGSNPPNAPGSAPDGQAGTPGEPVSTPGDAEPPSGPFAAITIPPVDQAGEDASFRAFRDRLLRIIRERDVEGLLAVVDPAVRNDFGGNDGIEAFRERWGLDEEAASSPLWPLLGDLLELGGVFTDDRRAFVAPYVFVLYDQYAGELDPFYHSVVTGAGVNVRAAPSLDSAVLERVSHLVVRVLPAEGEPPATIAIDGRTYAWRKVQLPSGTVGYLAEKYLWSPVGYRVRFERTDGGWGLVFLLAGD